MDPEQSSSLVKGHFFFFFFFRERAHACASGWGGGQREREGENLKQVPDMGLRAPSHTPEIMS